MASPSRNTNNQDPVARLAAFLRQGKSDIKVLTGKNKLSLTTIYLSILNRCFATTHPNDSSTEVEEGGRKYDAESVVYLRDILHRTVGLKLLHESATLQGAVDVSRFHALTVLEVKRVPVHFLVGLSSLRSQLRVLICSRCVHTLQMLLVGCGGDKAEEQDWPVLHTLNLSHNYIDALDESLRFLPALKALDLSHNNIRHTRDYFESLPEIIHLNLSFNQLTRVPSLGEFIPSNLQTLLLRGNNVESLSGVEYLEELGTLDLAKNAIFDTSELFSLGYMHRLRKMHFDGNPFTFQSKWRMIIARYLAPEAAQMVTFIDEIPLTKAEIQIVPKKGIKRPVLPDYLSDNFSASLRSDMSYDNLEDSMDLEASQKKRKARVKRLSTKVRNASISEQSEDQKQKTRQQISDARAISSSSPRSTPGTDAKKEFEDMRQMHGKDWLLALQNPYEAVSKAPVPTNQTAEQHDTTTMIKTDGLNNGDGTRTKVQADVHTVQDGDEQGHHPIVVVEEFVERTSMLSEESTGMNTSDGVKAQVIGQEDNESVQLLESKSSEQFDLLMRQESQLQIRIKNGDLKEEDHEEEEEDDGVDLCGPLLIRLHKTEPPVQLFVTIKETFIEEKNLFGKVVQILETKSLKGMNMTIEGMLDEFNNAPVELPVVKLSFDYINKERRNREYVMEDMHTCESFIQVLEPMIVQNEASQTRVFLQCLKCMLEFPKDQAKKRVEKKPKKSNTWTSEEESGSDFESVSEVLTCPSCGSNMLLEIDDPRKSEVNTPMGSVASVDLGVMPMAASSPWKRDTVIVSPSNKRSFLQDPSVDIFSSNSSDLSYTKSASSTPSQLSPKKDRTKTNLGPAHGPRGQAIRDLIPSPSKDGSLTSSLSSQHSGTSSDYRLPDPSIKMEVSESNPVEELVNYPREKLKELLTTNKSGFRQSSELPSSVPQRYSLCPTDGGSVSSMDASGPPTPIQPLTSNPFDSHFRNSASTESKGDASKSSPSHVINGNAKTPADECDGAPASRKPNEVDNRTKPGESGGSGEVLNPKIDHRYSEDDIVVLDSAETTSNHNMVYRNAYHIQDGDHQDKDAIAVDAISIGRLDSNESDIAVISETDIQSSNSALTMLRNSSVGNLSATSDTVFEGNHQGNLNSQIDVDSPAAQRRQETSSDNHKSFLSSNEQDTIYNSYSSSESAAEVNGSGQWNVGSTNRSEMKRTVQSSPSHSINSVTVETSMLTMAEEDCRNVHHRLKLYFSMSVFGNDEEFTCLLRGTVYQFSKKLCFDGLVVVSRENMYILKITKEANENPSDWLAKKTQHPIKDLLKIHVGLGSQNVQFEFSSDGILYTIVVGDEKRTRQFAEVLMDMISKGAWKKKFKGNVWEHAQTFANLTDEVFVPQATGDTSYEVEPQINVFISSHLKTRTETKQGAEMRVEPLGVIVKATDIYLVEENHFYPLALGKNKKSVKGQHQFIPQGHRKISDISGLELYADSPTDVTVSFFSEDTGEESQWNINTTSDASLAQLLKAIKQPWKEMFGVDIQETVHPSIAIQDLT